MLLRGVHSPLPPPFPSPPPTLGSRRVTGFEIMEEKLYNIIVGTAFEVALRVFPEQAFSECSFPKHVFLNKFGLL